MRHGSSNNRRQRNRGNNSNSQRRNNNQKTQVFDSNGPDVRIRGTAFQVAEKYVALAKDAMGAGDTVLYQSYLQHAEHYQRIINSWEADSPAPQNFQINDKDALDDEDDLPAEAETEVEVEVIKKEIAKPDSDDDDALGLPSSLFGKPSSSSKHNSEMENS
jgi:hypothetical protein